MWSLGFASHSKPNLGSLPSKYQNQNRQYCLGVPDVSVVCGKHLNIAKVLSPSMNCHDFTDTNESSISGPLHIAEYSSRKSSPRMRPSSDLVIGKHDNSEVHSLKQNCADSESGISTSGKYTKKSRKALRRKTQNKHSKLSMQDIQEMMDINREEDTLTDFEVDVEDQSPVLQVFNQTEELLRIMSCSPPKITCLRRDHQYSFSESEDSFVVFEDGSDQETEFDSSDNSNCHSSSLKGVESCSPSKITCLSRDRQCSFTESEDSFIIFEDESDQKLEYDCSDNSNCDSDSEPEDYGSSLAMVIPFKKVRFPVDDDLCEIHPMIKWSYAYRSARKGPWEEYARDRDRFHKRITQTGNILAPILDSDHRTNIFKQRYENGVHELGNCVDL